MRVWMSWKRGHAGFCAFGLWGIVKAPRGQPLFSERYGYEKFWPLGFGWRCKVRRMRRLAPAPDTQR